jgi:hypothetical protein
LPKPDGNGLGLGAKAPAAAAVRVTGEKEAGQREEDLKQALLVGARGRVQFQDDVGEELA